MSEGIVVEDELIASPGKRDGSSSPISSSKTFGNSRGRDRSRSPNRLKQFDEEGTNTTSEKPHLMRARLFVGNVDHGMRRSELRNMFSHYGDVMGVSIHKGYAFVQMDRERNANRAINGEDDRLHMGARLHVEFSQAAKKAGARFEPQQERSRSPTRNRDRDNLLDRLEEKEAKLARVLAMEKELSYIRSQDDRYSRRPPSDYDRDHRRDYSPPPRGYDHSSRGRDYDRREPRDRSYFDRHSPPRLSPPMKNPGGFRDSMTYPVHKRQSGYDSRESSGYGRGGSTSGGYSSGSEPNVGYGNSSGGRVTGGKSSGAPPGWPGVNKSNPNQRPFSAPWN